MNYEIVELKEKTVAGLCKRTSNLSPDMGKIIGEVWQNFYSEIYETLAKGKNKPSYGIYTDYESDETGEYTFMASCETDGKNLSEKVSVRTIPAGKYAKFTAVGDVQKAVQETWGEIWKTHLNRAFKCDFEEYTSAEMNRAVISIYIGLK